MPRTMAPVNEQMDVFMLGTDSIEPEQELAKRLEEDRPLRIKLGVDPTSSDLHLGHMVPVQKLRALQGLGHHIIFIVGTYTARIGDPTGRNKLRPALDGDAIDQHAATYREQVLRVLDADKTEIVDNGTWLAPLNLLDLLQLCAKVTVARTLERDDFSKRYAEQKPIFLHEFLYPLMQGYDSVVLRPDIEMGGSDQRFNILAARDLMIAHDLKPQIGMFMPLLSGLDGAEKMSKSAGNAVGITETPLDMYSKILSISDHAMAAWWPLVSNRPPDEVRTTLDQIATGTIHPMQAKKELAHAVVTLYHGSDDASGAAAEWTRLHEDRSQGSAPADTPDLEITATEIEGGTIKALMLVEQASFMQKKSGVEQPLSRGAIRRLMSQGGLYLDDERLDDPDAMVPIQDGSILRMSRKQYRKVRIR